MNISGIKEKVKRLESEKNEALKKCQLLEATIDRCNFNIQVSATCNPYRAYPLSRYMHSRTLSAYKRILEKFSSNV